MFSEQRLHKVIAHLLIWIQLLTPGLSLLPMVARANEPISIQSTVQGLNSLILEDGAAGGQPPEPAARIALPTLEGDTVINKLPEPAPRAEVPVLNSAATQAEQGYFQVQRPHDQEAPILSGLPDLSLPPETTQENKNIPVKEKAAQTDEGANSLSSGATQMATLFSGEDRTDAAVNYARSLGEGLINQQINDWLNQYGNAKISVGTQQKLSGDLLIPLYETDNHLIFTQVGTRTNEDRNTANFGVGYRQYLSDWMLGVNTFYDYDYTGNNKRIGVGAEAWADYLKLAANGYIRQTNWHQSKLDSMEDYDERPANGFDLRANAYLPAWPNLGGSLKYEQYFGTGVSVGDSASPDDLKDNPIVVTAGLDYTPFPLMTFSAKRSVGDSNETSVGVDVSYRFGVPWYQQISADTVGLMRSLAGSKYDFVDRNYDIVMQYRKQDLLHIGLPATTTAQAAETVPVELTVARAKYGLKSVEWTVDPLLTARGGHYKIVSPTQLEVTLPAYDFGLDPKIAQNYKISAVASDNHGNASNTAETIISVIPSVNVVSKLTISPDDQSLIANNTDFYTITAFVTDGKGAPLADQPLTFSLDGLLNSSGKAGTLISAQGGSQTDSRQIKVTTQTNGQAAAVVRSTVAGQGQITVRMDNGNFSTGKIAFVGDKATAAVRQVHLNDSVNYKTADPKNNFTYTGLVQDNNGNPITGVQVFWDKDADGVTLSSGASTADNNGNATIQLQSGTRAVSNITVNARSDTQPAALDADQKVSFVAGDVDPSQSTFAASPSEITANGQTVSTLTLTLVDANANPIPGLADSLSVAVSGVGNAKTGTFAESKAGVYTATFSGTRAGTATLSALSGQKIASSQTPVVRLTADSSTAQIAQENLVIDPDGSPADGKTANAVTATVTDAYGNPVQGANVTFNVSGGAVLMRTSATSDANGVVTTTVTSTVAGSVDVGAVVLGKQTTGKTHFVADAGTAHVSTVTLAGNTTSKSANGTDSFIYTAKVVDANNNVVEGVVVTAAKNQSEGSLTASSGGKTDASGEMLMTLTSTKAMADVRVNATVGTTATVAADKAVSFVADITTAAVASLTVTADKAAANGVATDSVMLTVRDANNNPVPNAVISLTASNGATIATTITTGPDGSATATLTSKVAGASTVTATLNSSTQQATLNFVADTATATVTSLVVTTNNAAANGIATNGVQMVVRDANNNPVANAVVSLAASNGATIVATVTTDATGSAAATLTSKAAGPSTVTASLNGGSQQAALNFAADISTAAVTKLEVMVNGAAANGVATDSVKVTVQDTNNNPVPDAMVSLTASNGATIVATVRTGPDGSATATLTSKAAGPVSVTATLNDSSQSGTVNFVADSSTAVVTSLIVTADRAIADGVATNGVNVMVRDANNNPVPDAVVSLTASNGTKIDATVTTGTDGSAAATLTSKVAGASVVTATLNNSSQQATLNFVADASTAAVSNLEVTADGAAANGVATNGIKVTVRDVNNNPVPDAVVSLSASNGAAMGATVTTDATGSAAAMLTSKVAGASTVTASLNNSSKSGNVNFVADTSTAAVSNLEVTADGAAANGVATNGVKVTVRDVNNNPVPDAMITLSASNGATIVSTVRTGADGTATATLTSKVAGVVSITAAFNGSSKSVDETFVADGSTAKVTNLAVTTDNAVADNASTNSVTLMVRDANNNPVSSALVNLTADNGATIATTVTTGPDGSAVATMTSKVAGASGVTASLNGSRQNVSVTFIADEKTAQIVTATLVIAPDGAVANGVATNGVAAKVTDANGNAVPDMVVSFSAAEGAIITAVKGTSDDKGAVTATVTSLKAASYRVTATVEKTGKSASGTTQFMADASTAAVANLAVATDNAIADGAATNGVTVTVLDANQNPISGAVVSLSAGNGAKIVGTVTTDATGSAQATLTSKVAGLSTVTATLKGSSQNAAVTFIADEKTAQIVKDNLIIDPDAATADGKATNGVLAIVTDANNNPVPDMAVTFSVSSGAIITAVKGTSDAQGEVTATVTSLRAASYTVTATVDEAGSTASGTTTFVADATTAAVASLTVATDNAAADGVATDVVRVLVQDANGNPVPRVEVSLSADNGATIAKTVTTGADGRAPATLTSLMAGKSTVTASLVGSSKSVAVTFIGDAKTAEIVAANLVIAPDGAVADNKATNGVLAKVTDKNGNLVSGTAVTFSVSTGATIVAVKGTSDEKGEVTATVTSLKAASYTVTAKVVQTGKTASGTTTFVADISTARVATVTLTDATTTKIANGTDSFTFTARLIDANSNAVTQSGVKVSWTQDKSDDVVLSSTESETNAQGEATVQLTSTLTLVSNVQVSAQYAATAVVAADKRGTFTYDVPASVTIKTTDGGTDAVVGTQPSLAIEVVDAYGHTLPNQTVSLTLSGDKGGKPSVYPTSVSSNAQGVVVTQPLIADTTAEGVTVTGTVAANKATGTVVIHFTPDVVSTNTSTISATPASITADTLSTSTITYAPKDRYGNVIDSIQTSSITSDVVGMNSTDVSLSDWKSGNGQYTATLRSGSVVGSLKVIPVISGKDGVSRTGDDILTLTAGQLDITKSSITAVPNSIIADGKSTTTLRFVPKDVFGNVSSTLDVSKISQVITGEATDLTVSDWRYNANSQWYTATLTSGVILGGADIMPTVAGNNAASIGVTRTLTLQYSSTVKDIDSTSVGTAVADGVNTNAVTVTIYGDNKQVKANQPVTITPSNGELLMNGKSGVYTGTTDTAGKLTVTMSSTLIGENEFTVESDQYSEPSATTFGTYVSPTLSSLNFDKTDLYNNGTDKMTVAFYPRDAKGRNVANLPVTVTSTDTAATLSQTGYQARVSSKSSPSTYFISVKMSNYTLWQPEDAEYQLIPTSGVKLATLTIQPKLCGRLSSGSSPIVCAPTPANDKKYHSSGLGFVVKVIERNAIWDNKMTLTSSDVDGYITVTGTDNKSTQNCSAPVSDSSSWMNDFGRVVDGVPYSVAMDFSKVSSHDTVELGPKAPGSGGGIGLCDLPSWSAINSTLSGAGSIIFLATTKSPASSNRFSVPLTGNRIDAGLVSKPMTVYVYSD